jgi:hypothetical protein
MLMLMLLRKDIEERSMSKRMSKKQSADQAM